MQRREVTTALRYSRAAMSAPRMKPTLTEQKLRGGYYTPAPIASFLSRWAIQDAEARTLEPSCGDGNILAAMVQTLGEVGADKKAISCHVQAVEYDKAEAAIARSRMESLGLDLPAAGIVTGDFFEFCRERLNERVRYDAIVGNPPFVRYQNFPEKQRAIAFGIMESAGMQPTRLTNTWVPFLVGSTLLLDDHGRLAMVIPAELLQVSYAAELRQFLIDHFSRLTLVTFRNLVFGDIQQEVVLFLGEKNGKERTGIRTVEVGSMADLESFRHPDFSKEKLKPLDHSREKWTQYFLDSEEIALLRKVREIPGLSTVGSVADVEVGIVTGLNDFFVLSSREAKEHGIEAFTGPLVSRSPHLPGILFSPSDYASNLEKNVPALLVEIPDVRPSGLPSAVKAYIAQAEAQGWHKGYKCRIRNPWYVAPSVWTPDAFMLRQINRYPKVVVNETKATCTDTIHRVRFHNGTDRRAFGAAFLNSLTFAFSEVMGRSYGGGVLELEPREATALPIPLKGSEDLDAMCMNQLVLTGAIDEALDITDDVLLRQGLGLTAKDTRTLRGIWTKLRDRRSARRGS